MLFVCLQSQMCCVFFSSHETDSAQHTSSSFPFPSRKAGNPPTSTPLCSKKTSPNFQSLPNILTFFFITSVKKGLTKPHKLLNTHGAFIKVADFVHSGKYNLPKPIRKGGVYYVRKLRITFIGVFQIGQLYAELRHNSHLIIS